jgi:branched-chain amino acid transport system permease protein
LPSLTLLGQSLVSGVLVGGLYGLLALGLSLGWGLLRLVNLGHFGLAILGAYLTWWLGSVHHIPPWFAALIIVPGFFVLGLGLHWIFWRFRVTELASMLITFGLAVVIESIIQWIWTADFRRFETPYGSDSFQVGSLFIPVLDFVMCVSAIAFAFLTWGWLRWTYVGKALRACAEDPAMATAFGIDHRTLSFLLSGICAAYAGIAGVYVALIFTLSPSQIWAWLGVIFAVVIIGRLGNPVGALVAGFVIGMSEAVTMVAFNPAWAPLVSFSVLIGLLLWKPRWL